MKYLIDTDWLIDHLNGVEKVRSKLEELAPEGLVISLDLFIASTCLYHNLTLLTNNVSHFERIEALNIIAI